MTYGDAAETNPVGEVYTARHPDPDPKWPEWTKEDERDE